MTDPVTLGYGNNKWLFDANTEMITLSNSKSAIGTYDMYSGYTGAWASFTVPAGQKFIALKIQLNVNESSGAAGTGGVILSDGAAGAAGTTFWECGVSTNQSQGNNPFSSYDVFIEEWAAGQHVNITFNTADYWFASITGILTTT
jgi:hypothetical protein